MQKKLFSCCIIFLLALLLTVPTFALDSPFADVTSDAFGTFVCTNGNDDWLNVYANYDIERDTVCDTLELNLCRGDGTEESWHYPLNAAEKEVLLRKTEEFCQQQTDIGLHEYSQQFREELEQQGPEMKM